MQHLNMHDTEDDIKLSGYTVPCDQSEENEASSSNHIRS
jgi:hypothetical protein